MMSLATLLLALIAPITLWIASRHWQRALFGVFVLLIFEGALRKWVLPGAQAQIYLLKDVILLGVYLGFFLDRRRTQPTLRDGRAIKIILVVAFGFGCLEVLNPSSPSVLVGLAGLKTYFLYAPIAFVLPYAIKSREHLLYLVRWYLIIAIPVAILGFVQVAAGPNSFISTYVSYSDDPAVLVRFGQAYDLVRTSGTFSYISGYSAYLSFIAFLAIGYNMAQSWRIKGNVVLLLALTVVIGAMFTTGSRGPIFTLIATGPIIFWLAVTGRILALRTAVRMAVTVLVVGFVALNLSPRAYEGFSNRVSESGDSTISRLLAPFDQTAEALSEAPVFGVGIGTTHPSAMAIMGTDWPWWLQGMFTEAEMARVTVELGFVGLFLTYLLRLLIAVVAFRSSLSFKDPVYRSFGIVLAIYLGLGVIGSIILNPTAGLYYWGSLGLVFAMRRLEQTAHRKVKTDQEFAWDQRWRTARPARSAVMGEN